MSVITQKNDNICDGAFKKMNKQSVLAHYSDNICDLCLEEINKNYR